MDEKLGLKIIASLEACESPISDVVELVNQIKNTEERQKLRRILGEVIASIASEIPYTVRKNLGILRHKTKNSQ